MIVRKWLGVADGSFCWKWHPFDPSKGDDVRRDAAATFVVDMAEGFSESAVECWFEIQARNYGFQQRVSGVLDGFFFASPSCVEGSSHLHSQTILRRPPSL